MSSIESLQREVRALKIYAGLTTLAVAAALLMGARHSDSTASFNKLRAERIDIVDAAGKTRMVLTGPQHMPGAGGPTDNRPGGRNFVAPAILFYDEAEHEYGGLLPRAKTGNGEMTALIFDYSKQEAGGFFTQQKPDGSGFAALMINDPPPADMPHEQAIRQSFNRIKIMNPEQNAEVVLSDAQGKPRIQLRVTREGEAYMEILGKDGKVAYRAPEQ